MIFAAIAFSSTWWAALNVCIPGWQNRGIEKFILAMSGFALAGFCILAITEAIHWVMTGESDAPLEEYFWKALANIGNFFLMAAGLAVVTYYVTTWSAVTTNSTCELGTFGLVVTLAIVGTIVRIGSRKLMEWRSNRRSQAFWRRMQGVDLKAILEPRGQPSPQSPQSADAGDEFDDEQHDELKRKIRDEIVKTIDSSVNARDQMSVSAGACALIEVLGVLVGLHGGQDACRETVERFEEFFAEVRSTRTAN
jgi:hypothetical protein